MDFTSLVAANLAARRRPGRDARAEAQYWRARPVLPRPGLRLLGSLATTAGVVLLLLGIAQV